MIYNKFKIFVLSLFALLLINKAPANAAGFTYYSFLSIPNAPVFYNTGSSSQLCFNNAYINDTTPLFRLSATCSSGFNRFKIEINTTSTFSGTAHIQIFSGTYTSGAQYDLECNGLSPSLPVTNNVTYYVRSCASGDGGSTWGSWSTGVYSFTFTTSATTEWLQTTKPQFDTDVLTGASQTNVDFVNLGTGSGMVFQVSAATDDAYDQSCTPSNCAPDNQVELSKTYLRAGHKDLDTYYGTQTAGMRFQNITIPQGTVITSAKLQVKTIWVNPPDNNDKGNTQVYWKIGADKVSNSPTFSTSASGKPSGRTLTTAQVNWNLVDFVTDRWYNAVMNDVTTGDWENSPDISSVVQEIINMPTWTSGNSLSIIVANTTGLYNAYRTWHAYESGASYAAKLVINQTNNGTILSSMVDYISFKSACGWNIVKWNDDETYGNIIYQVYYDNGGTPLIIPDADLPGNSTGFGTSPVNISGLNYVTYSKLYIKATLTNVGGSPMLNDWGITVRSAGTVQTSATATNICQGDTTTLQATVTGGTLPFGYAWTPSSNISNTGIATPKVWPPSSTTYTVVVTDGTGCTSSSSININITSGPAATVSISANPAGTVCSGTNVTFTATPANGGTPAYQWFVNGNPVGTNSSSYSNNTFANGDHVYCIMTSSLTCVTGSPATSNTVTMAVTAGPPASISITANPAGAVCNGTNVTFTATPTNGGTPAYQWFLNGNPVGTNSPVWTSNTLANGDIVHCQMTSSLTCVSGSPAVSNNIIMTVSSNLSVSISITAYPAGPVCSGSGVTFTAIPGNGGNTPLYQWYLNGLPAGSNASSYIDSIFVNNDVITCQLTSSETCATGNPATSNAITMTVDSTLAAHISVTASANPVCAGTSVTFTAIPINGGTSPTYQWRWNGNITGSNSPTYTNAALANGDKVKCWMDSSIPCATGSPTLSNLITMVVNPLPFVNLGNDTVICSNQSLTLDAGPGYQYTYQWSNGASGETITLNGATLGTGTWPYNVNVVTLNNCHKSDTILITVSPCTGIDNNTNNAIVSYYPNPVHDILYINIRGNGFNRIGLTVTDILGREVYYKNIENNTNKMNTQIDMSKFPAGIYVLKVKAGEREFVSKIIAD